MSTVDSDALAQALHSATVRLLRRLRAGDADQGLSAPRASALSVLVFGGEMTIGRLAALEQVTAPTISRLIRDMEADGLVQRRANAEDARSVLIAATALGQDRLLDARARRLALLQADLAALSDDERAILAKATELLVRMNEGPDPAQALPHGLPRP